MLDLMNGQANGVNGHMFLKGSGSTTLECQLLLGTTTPWKQPIRETANFGADWQRWELEKNTSYFKFPMLCNAGGSFANISFRRVQKDVPLTPILTIAAGFWLVEDCGFEYLDYRGMGISVTETAMLSLKRSTFQKGFRFGVEAERNSFLVLEDVEFDAIRMGVVVVDDAAAFLLNCSATNCHAGVFIGNHATVRIYQSRFLDNAAAFEVRIQSCTTLKKNYNTYAQLELVASVVRGPLWANEFGELVKLRNFVDQGNTYLGRKDNIRSPCHQGVNDERA
mmetsp:Transcript_31802/g.49751  ORF Transcript_31802/g.49751 Transcript_31802/m.49751 type:complete len:280 (-) Transcript_31802:2418-3257(-)